MKYPSNRGYAIICDWIIVAANEEAKRIFNMDIVGLKLMDLIDQSERETATNRVSSFIETMKRSRKTNIYLSNSEIMDTFYMAVRSKPILWHGKKAVLAFVEKINVPAQIPLSFTNNSLRKEN